MVGTFIDKNILFIIIFLTHLFEYWSKMLPRCCEKRCIGYQKILKHIKNKSFVNYNLSSECAMPTL